MLAVQLRCVLSCAESLVHLVGGELVQSVTSSFRRGNAHCRSETPDMVIGGPGEDNVGRSLLNRGPQQAISVARKQGAERGPLSEPSVSGPTRSEGQVEFEARAYNLPADTRDVRLAKVGTRRRTQVGGNTAAEAGASCSAPCMSCSCGVPIPCSRPDPAFQCAQRRPKDAIQMCTCIEI